MAEYTATSGSYTTTLTVTEGAYDIASNTSPVTFTLTLKKNSGTGLWNNDSCPWSININGTSYSGSFTYDFRNYSSLTLKSSTTQTITHDSDGTKKIAVSASVNMDNTPYVYTMSPSGELTLATIPRASDIALSVSSFSITSSSGNAFSWSITAKSNSFYNRLRYSIGNKSNVSSNKGQGSSSGYFTNQELLSALPSSTSGSLTVYCDTYSDSGYSNLIGSKSVVITVSVNTSYIKPSVSLGNIGINSSPISGYAVAGYSKVQSAFTATNSSGASGVTTYFTVSHGSLATTSSTSTSGTVVSNVIPSNSSNYTLTIYAYAKDSRGAISDTVSKAITVYGYQPPTATLTAYRTSTSSSTNEDGAGTYAYTTFSGAVRSSVNSQNTIQSTVCTYSGDISGTATNGQHIALGDTQTATFRLTVTDKVTSSTASVTITKATYPLDLYDNGSGTVGVGVGTTAIANYLITPLSFKVDNGNSPSGYVSIWEDGEGGNIEIGSPNGKFFQIDSNNDITLRCYSEDDGGNYTEFAFNRTNGMLSATGGFNGKATSAGQADNATNATNLNYFKCTSASNIGLDVATNGIGYTSVTRADWNRQQVDGALYTQRYSASWQHQIYGDYRTGGIAVRGKTSGVWQPWHLIEMQDTLWTGSLTGTNSIDLDISAYKRIRIYAQYATTQQMIWEVDVTKLHATTQYRANHCELSWLDSAWYHTIFETFISKAKFTLSNVYNMNSSGTTYAQNNSTAYQIYRIDGIL